MVLTIAVGGCKGLLDLINSLGSAPSLLNLTKSVGGVDGLVQIISNPGGYKTVSLLLQRQLLEKMAVVVFS